MERIKQALERAREQRGDTAPAAKAEWVRARAPAATPQEVVYTQTRQVDLDPDYLRHNRVISGPADRIGEPYKILRTKVLQRMRANGWQSLAITSPTQGCGKTLTAINLAISIAREVNQTVLLVDLDLRRPQVSTYFTTRSMPGIGDHLVNDAPVEGLLFNPKGIDRLVVLPGNTPISHSSEMLSSPKMVALAEELRSRYPSRIVIMDMPPVLACDDVLAFSPYFDAVLLVAEEDKTRKEEMARAVSLLEKTNLLGSVLNKSSIASSDYYY
jgi:capsular exopolysaccharide synthesis family protein